MRMLKATAVALLLQTALMGTVYAQALNGNPMSDVRVRQAIAYAIDKDTIIATVLGGYAVRADGLLPNGPFKSPNLDPYPFNPDKARELLKQAGWDSSRTLEMVFYYDDQVTANLMTVLQAELADVGITMNYHLLVGDVAKTLNSIPDDPKGKSVVTWDLGYGARAAIAMQEYFNDYATGKASADGFPGSPELDGLIADSNSSTDPEVTKKALMSIDEYINKNALTIPLYYQQLYAVESNRLNRNGEPHGNDQFNYDWNIQNWTVEPDADGKKVMYTNAAPVDYFEEPWVNLGLWAGNKMIWAHMLSAKPFMDGVAEGDLADTYKVSDDGKTVTFTMRDGTTWQDGEPITTDDVVWSLETALKVPTLHGVLANTFNSIEGAADFVAGTAPHISGISVDGKTITIKFAKVDPNVLLSFTQWGPLPKKYFEGVDPTLLQQAPFWQKPVGSGPFMVEEAKFGDFTSFVPFDGYWKGKAKIDQIIAWASGDGDANMVKNAAAHRIDFAITKAVNDLETLKTLDFMKLTPLDIPYTRMIWINQYDK
ncbi:MAG: peptide ABC transporter substrate-binding protein [Devosia nanyangense]|uniref:Peptide ABC transporter substrate-binding protein n=1 Tax=Devosia nanyangense TaxID=1228055 RepID=A0A933L271_9HYPH|nr:peptide ABC transporter substrate-binding protein [Devosia nanyangense]